MLLALLASKTMPFAKISSRSGSLLGANSSNPPSRSNLRRRRLSDGSLAAASWNLLVKKAACLGSKGEKSDLLFRDILPLPWLPLLESARPPLVRAATCITGFRRAAWKSFPPVCVPGERCCVRRARGNGSTNAPSGRPRRPPRVLRGCATRSPSSTRAP